MKIKYIEKPEVFFVSNQSIEEIAKKFGVSVSSLKTYNNISFVHKGSILAIPTEQVHNQRHYVVKPADTLDNIAYKLGVSKEVLKQKNNTSRVFIGQMLFY